MLPLTGTDDRVQRQQRWMALFIRYDQVAAALGGFALVLVRVFVSETNNLFVLIAMLGVTTATIGSARRPLARGDLEGAVTRIAVADWFAALGVAAFVPWAESVMVLTALMPALLAVPFVDRQRLRVLVAIAVAVSLGVVALSRLQDFSGTVAQMPDWMSDVVLLSFLPVLLGLICLMVFQNNSLVGHMLDDALATNRRLEASESALMQQANELRASRARLVAAGDEARRRIERDLHDGAQQRLLGLVMRLGFARDLVRRDPVEAEHALDALRGEALGAVGDLRQLANGVYPPVLADHGLAEALTAVSERFGDRCRLEIEAVGRYRPDIEATVYFCCLEALQNAIKHAGDGPIVLGLRADAGSVRFEVRDGGVGFDIADVRPGNGFTSFRDRIGSVGGTVSIESAPGRGTRIVGLVATG